MRATGRGTDQRNKFSRDRAYRYALWRGANNDREFRPYIMWIGLNPSTADETRDDATIRRIKRFSLDFGYGTFVMTNLFAWRETKSNELLRVMHPIGEDNDFQLLRLAADASMIIACWGTKGGYLGRDLAVLRHLRHFPIHCLGLTREGHPKHPLRLAAATRPTLWKRKGGLQVL